MADRILFCETSSNSIKTGSQQCYLILPDYMAYKTLAWGLIVTFDVELGFLSRGFYSKVRLGQLTSV